MTISRRDFLRGLTGTCFAPVMLNGCFQKQWGGPTKRRPNIIVILTDDQRFDAARTLGHPWMQTPGIDRLVQGGVTFRNAFATTALCSPSRASFLTGCYAHRHGVITNSRMDPDPALPTLPALLQQSGYRTAMIGKWHMAPGADPRPGFDHWVSFDGQGEYQGNLLNVDGIPHRCETYLTDELNVRALNFIREASDQPYFLWLSHKAAHENFTPAERHRTLYADITPQLPSREGEHPEFMRQQWPSGIPARWREIMLDYARTLAAVDDGVLAILAELQRAGTLQDTVLVFAGDNGYMMGENGRWEKRAAYETSMRIPLVMHYPAMIPANSSCVEQVLNIDLAPTLLQLACATAPSNMDGMNLLPLLDEAKGRDHFLYEYGREPRDPRNRPTINAIRTRDTKLITYPELSPICTEVYDLAADPGERINLFGSAAGMEIEQRLRPLLDAHLQAPGYRSFAAWRAEWIRRGLRLEQLDAPQGAMPASPHSLATELN